MICSNATGQDPKDGETKNLCACRPDMAWDADLMECRLYIDVDCTFVDAVNLDDQQEIVQELNKKGPLSSPASGTVDSVQFTKDQIDQAFCNLIERYMLIMKKVLVSQSFLQ